MQKDDLGSLPTLLLPLLPLLLPPLRLSEHLAQLHLVHLPLLLPTIRPPHPRLPPSLKKTRTRIISQEWVRRTHNARQISLLLKGVNMLGLDLSLREVEVVVLVMEELGMG